jgi:hypothetical protein
MKIDIGRDMDMNMNITREGRGSSSHGPCLM